MQFFPSRAIFLTVGPLSIHWYGIMYLLAFLLSMWLLPRLERYRRLQLTDRQRESLLIHTFFGVLVGGRLGVVLFYDLPYFLQHPFDIFAVWQGGMSSHGGVIGVTIGLLLFARKYRIDVARLADILMVPVAIGLAFGRVGNFINLELYGTVTTLPWGMAIPGVEGLRHPTQIYAVIKDLTIALVAFAHLRRTAGQTTGAAIGRTVAIFMVLYGILRCIVELFRDQAPYGYTIIAGLPISRGQLLTVPIILFGIALWFFMPQVRSILKRLGATGE